MATPQPANAEVATATPNHSAPARGGSELPFTNLPLAKPAIAPDSGPANAAATSSTSTPTPGPDPAVGLSPTPPPTMAFKPTPTPLTGVPVVLESGTDSIEAGHLLTVHVRVHAASDRSVDTAQVYLEFDAAKLQVQYISAGPRLEYHLQSDWDNIGGSVACAAGTLGPAAVSPLTLCSVTFRALAAAAPSSTQVEFVLPASIHRTKVVHRGLDITGQLSLLDINIR